MSPLVAVVVLLSFFLVIETVALACLAYTFIERENRNAS